MRLFFVVEDQQLQDLKFDFTKSDQLYEAFVDMANTACYPFLLRLDVSKQRIMDAFIAWENDMVRMQMSSQGQSYTPDHFKSAATLAYWLRRFQPITTILNDAGGAPLAQARSDIPEIGDYEVLGWKEREGRIQIDRPEQAKYAGTYGEYQEPEKSTEIKLKTKDGIEIAVSYGRFLAQRERIQSYANEYFAFTWGLRLAQSYQHEKDVENGVAAPLSLSFAPDEDLIECYCYFLKYKNVSPHAIFLVYKSLLFAR